MRRVLTEKTTHIVAAVLITLAGALSALWVFTVPIFQAPDEPAHYDYALSISKAHRLIRAGEATHVWIANATSNYLMKSVDFNRISWHSSARVPRDYGQARFYRQIDANAPVDAAAKNHGPPTVSWLVSTYPFGFYALEAVWMGIAWNFSHSEVTQFFMARLFCVVLMAIGLGFCYATTVNLKLPRPLRLLLIAAVGFFPLTSFVSSYVQPDNLVFTALSALFFFATLRRGSLALRLSGIGLSLGILSIAKLHFFLSALLPTIAFVLYELYTIRANATRAVVAVLGLVVPTAVLMGVQHWTQGGAIPGVSQQIQSDISLDVLKNAFAGGTLSGLGYILHSVLASLNEYFITGFCANSFWGLFGWFDTPLVIVNPWITWRILDVVMIVSVFVLIATVVVVAGNLLRLRYYRHVRAILRTLMRDVLFNSYACFVILMIGLYVVTNNVFVAEGRHWYPYVFATFVAVVLYAPRALKSFRRKLTYTFAILLAGYSLVGAAYAYASIQSRYYGPPDGHEVAIARAPEPIGPERADGIITDIASTDYQVIGRYPPVIFPIGTELEAGGAAGFDGAQPAKAVAVLLDGHIPLPVIDRQYEPRIAAPARSFEAGHARFTSVFETTTLREGPHVVSAYAQTLDGKSYARIFPLRLFFLARHGRSLSPEFIERLDRLAHIPGTVTWSSSCLGDAHASVTLPHGALSSDESVWLLLDRKVVIPLYAQNTVDGAQVFAQAVAQSQFRGKPKDVRAFATSGLPSSERQIGSKPADIVATSACR